ncbi:hypothetical protein BDW74DRAFT_179977 [Aspergillus multicolor]|uniref:glycoside hydrolase family 43 protein n=1 Tax=Aspergillus multicolor TaxID=41759 RepID=UPI003CCD35F1
MPPSKSLSPLLALAGATMTIAQPTHVLDTDFPDPAVLRTDSGYYAFGTGSNGVNVQIAHSPDFVSWSLLDGTDGLSGPFPGWVQGDSPLVWAPDVVQLDDGTFVMYFSALSSSDNSKHCLGTATSVTITGPYTPTETSFACPLDLGGAIDASGFTDADGSRYVVYKVDGNSLNNDGTMHSTPIMLQKVQNDGITPDGEAIQILDRDPNGADGPLVEAPSLVLVDGIYYLMFSSGMYSDPSYDASYATAASITGPYTKAQAPDAPLLVSGDAGSSGPLGGPGGADFLDGHKMVFHAFNDGRSIESGRGMWVVDMQVGGGKITLL